MSRYIDADLIKKKAFQYYDESFKVDIEDVDSIPTADVAPVRHGRWVYNNSPVLTAPTYRCSECSQTADDAASNFCSNCGAKMDMR